MMRQQKINRRPGGNELLVNPTFRNSRRRRECLISGNDLASARFVNHRRIWRLYSEAGLNC